MSKRECIAMLLAGGQGSRLGALTREIAKPGVSFGGKYRIIDFSLSNCANSEIMTVGVLTQYRPYHLHSYIGTGAAWNLDENDAGVSILPPFATEKGGSWYAGTADAIKQNLEFLEAMDSEYTLILSGDHLYRMDYRKMLNEHKEHNADLTVSVRQVPWEDRGRFGIMKIDDQDRITSFVEKSEDIDSNLASMGIYIFTTQVLIDALRADSEDPDSEHDFGKNIIPKLLAAHKRLYCYEFQGFWKDVGTIASFHETNMELLGEKPKFNLFDPNWPIMSNAPTRPPHFVGIGGSVLDSIIANGSRVFGEVVHSVLSTDSYVGPCAVVEDSVLLPGAMVQGGARVVRSIIGENAIIKEGVTVGTSDPSKNISVVGNDVIVERRK